MRAKSCGLQSQKLEVLFLGLLKHEVSKNLREQRHVTPGTGHPSTKLGRVNSGMLEPAARGMNSRRDVSLVYCLQTALLSDTKVSKNQGPQNRHRLL